MKHKLPDKDTTGPAICREDYGLLNVEYNKLAGEFETLKRAHDAQDLEIKKLNAIIIQVTKEKYGLQN